MHPRYRRKVIGMVTQHDTILHHYGGARIIDIIFFASYGRTSKKQIMKVLEDMKIQHVAYKELNAVSGGVSFIMLCDSILYRLCIIMIGKLYITVCYNLRIPIM